MVGWLVDCWAVKVLMSRAGSRVVVSMVAWSELTLCNAMKIDRMVVSLG